MTIVALTKRGRGTRNHIVYEGAAGGVLLTYIDRQVYRTIRSPSSSLSRSPSTARRSQRSGTSLPTASRYTTPAGSRLQASGRPGQRTGGSTLGTS